MHAQNKLRFGSEYNSGLRTAKAKKVAKFNKIIIAHYPYFAGKNSYEEFRCRAIRPQLRVQ